MYGVVLTIHSWFRWIALLLGTAASINALRDPLQPSARPPGARWDTFFMLAVDLQVLFGLVLYFGLSPYTTEAMTNIGAAMRTPVLRFWSIEHVAFMATAVALVRLGRILAMTAKTPTARRTRRFACFAAATLIMVMGIPWPGLAHSRPLFRLVKMSL